MVSPVRSTAPHSLVSHRFVVSSRCIRILVTACFILSILFFLETVARGQAVTFNGFQSNVPATGLAGPWSTAVDAAGDVYIADSNHARVVKVTPAGVQTTVPATGLTFPQGVAVDSAGDVYIADPQSDLVIKVTSAGVQTTVPTTGLVNPWGVAVDSAGDVYIADPNSFRVVEVTPGGVQTTVPATVANPAAVAVDGAGDVYIADVGLQSVVEVTPGGVQTTVPATGLTAPEGVAVDSAGNVYIADVTINNIIKVTPAGVQSNLPLSNVYGPRGVTVDSAGNIYASSYANNTVPELSQTVNFGSVAVGSLGTSNQQSLTYTFQSADTLTAINVLTQGATGKDYTSGTNTTCALNHAYAVNDTCTVQVNLAPVYPGVRMGAVQLADSTGTQATTYLRTNATGPLGSFQPGTQTAVSAAGLNQPSGIAVDGAGNVYISDVGANQVVEVTPAGVMTTVNTGAFILNEPFSVAVDGAGNLYIADIQNNRIVEVTPGGVQTTVPANGLAHPYGVAVDGAGNVYIADRDNYRVVEVTPSGVQTTLPVTGVNQPVAVAVDGAGDVYIANVGTSSVLKFTPDGTTTTVSTGSLTLSEPYGVAVDAAGDVYIADFNSAKVVEVTPAGTTTALNVSVGGHGLAYPVGVAADGSGDVYIADIAAERVLQVNRALQSLTFADTYDGQTSTDSPQSVTVQNIGNQPLAFTDVAATTNFNLNGAGTTCTSSTSLTPGVTCGLGVEFAPVAAGSLTGTVNLTGNSLNAVAPGNVQQISLSGTGIGFAATIGLAENPGITVATGTAVTVNATLTGSNGVPTGNITYTLDGTLQPSVAISSGVAQFILPGTLSIGQHSVVVSYAGDADYQIASATQGFTLTVTPPPSVTVTFASPSIFVAPGGSASDVLTITPQYGYTGTLQFSCTGLPTGATCSFQPSPVTINGSPANVTLTVQTTAPTTAELRSLPPPSHGKLPGNPVIPAGIFWLPGGILAAVAGSRRKLSKRMRHWLVLLLLLGSVGAMTACGGGSSSGNSGTPAGTSNVQVSVTGPGISQTASVRVVVE